MLKSLKRNIWLALLSLLLSNLALAEECSIQASAEGIQVGMQEACVVNLLGEPSVEKALISTYSIQWPEGAVEYQYPHLEGLSLLIVNGVVTGIRSQQIDLTFADGSFSFETSLEEARTLLDSRFSTPRVSSLSESVRTMEWSSGDIRIACVSENDTVLFWTLETIDD